MGINATIKTTRQILENNLAIPPYQRPYRWTTENVVQLLEDIRSSMAAGKLEYRIGTVICHKVNDKTHYDLVDGQQRLTTILIVLCKLKKNIKNIFTEDDAQIIDDRINALKYKGNSISAIYENSAFAEEWLKDNILNDAKTFAEYVFYKCRFVEIVVDDLGEAFQMFDTQNGRGKSLELYNLLKAYHIRAMEQNTQEERIRCDINWEGATQYDATPGILDDPNVDILGHLFGEQLFKSRLWCRNENARVFTRNDIGEFKGFTIDKNHPIDFPFQNPFLLQYLTEKFYRNVLAGTIGSKSRLEAGETENLNPFVNINQQIINGKAFFEYIETYVELYKKMFIELGSYQLAEFKRFFYLYCLTYLGNGLGARKKWDEEVRKRTDSFRDICGQASRDGDAYLRESYKSICFVLLDKFGENVLMKYYKTLYRLIYKVRIEHYAVKQITAFSEPKTLFAIIHRAKYATELLELNKHASALKDGKYEYDDKLPKELVAFIKNGECHERL